jgi:hypothetical protein
MNEYEVCIVVRVEATDAEHAETTARDRLRDVVEHDRVWADVLSLQHDGKVLRFDVIYATEPDQYDHGRTIT